MSRTAIREGEMRPSNSDRETPRTSYGARCCLIVLLSVFAGCSGDGGPAAAVPAEVASVTISPNDPALVVGATQQLTATLHDAAGNVLSGRPISWSSSETAVASVSAAGLVGALTRGQATVTATSEGKVGSTTVSVSVLAFVAVAAGGAHTCALTANGAAFCWGRNEAGQLGRPSATVCTTIGLLCSMTPLAVQGGINFAQLTGGGAHTCGLTSDGTAYCWGENSHGQLGDKSSASGSAPTPVSTALKFVRINAGEAHTCALTSDGAAHCWGRNNGGQLGDGTITSRSEPTPVASALQFQFIDAGGYGGPIDNPFPGFTCGLTIAGDAYCWGENAYGTLGRGTSGFPERSPAAVSGGLKFVSLTVGLNDHACALTAGGQAHCWGANFRGSVGDGTADERPAPVPVSGGLNFVQLAAGGFNGHTCGRSGGGNAYCWGDNETGQVGDGTRVDRLTPAAVIGGLTFTSLDAGYRHTCGIANSIVYCWGSNGAGQLGNNSTISTSEPVRVLGQADPTFFGHSGRSRFPR